MITFEINAQTYKKFSSIYQFEKKNLEILLLFAVP